MSKWQHRLSNINLEEKTADCLACGGQVRIKKSPAMLSAQCKNYINARRQGYIYKPTTQKPKACEICLQEKPLVYDHGHATGLHRGWLCHNCNTLLGLAHDKPAILKRAIEYLAQ